MSASFPSLVWFESPPAEPDVALLLPLLPVPGADPVLAALEFPAFDEPPMLAAALFEFPEFPEFPASLEFASPDCCCVLLLS